MISGTWLLILLWSPLAITVEPTKSFGECQKLSEAAIGRPAGDPDFPGAHVTTAVCAPGFQEKPKK